jgi:thiamine-phosphate pyrophosphorylase
MTEPQISPFYPILPDADWIARLVPIGIRTVQLRYKSDDTTAIRRQIAQALEICIAHECLLVVNDHWREALLVGAESVHLGQEDLRDADLATLAARAVSVGLSTHDLPELALAQRMAPASIALGPIYATPSKSTGRQPQGLAQITNWRGRIGSCHLTAIGGITLEQAPHILAAGADSIAVISDVTKHADPELRVRQWLTWERSVIRPAT